MLLLLILSFSPWLAWGCVPELHAGRCLRSCTAQATECLAGADACADDCPDDDEQCYRECLRQAQRCLTDALACTAGCAQEIDDAL